MNNASGSQPDKKKHAPLINQRSWRAAGVLCIGGCVLLAWFGQGAFLRNNTDSPLILLGYWGLFLLLLLTSFYIVLLDLRYIRMQYKMGERELFQDTLQNEQFRKALLEAKTKQENPASSAPKEEE